MSYLLNSSLNTEFLTCIISELPYSAAKQNISSNKRKSGSLNDSLKVKAENKKLTKEILNLIVNSTENEITANQENHTSEIPFIRYNNSVIKSISFRQLEVFGPTLSDTSKKASTWIEKTGNKFHFKTNEKILRNYLLINDGDLFNAVTLSDNERVIRELPFIEDVRFLIVPNIPNADTVDIFVVVKEKWAVGFGMEISSVSSGEFGVWNKNIFGWGHENQYNVFWNTKKPTLLGYEGIYKINNISGSFISSNFRYLKKYETEYYKIEFQRRFFTPNIKYAGGAIIEYNDTRRSIELLDTILEDQPVNFNNYDFWVGRSFNITSSKNFLTNSRTNLMFSGRFMRKTYSDRPTTSSDILYEFHDRYMILGSAAISKQGYFKSHLIYGFSQTEDIPFGILLEFIAGFEFSEYLKRPYLGTSFSHGTYLWKFGYLYNRFDLGGFYHKNAFKQNVISITSKYFTHLLNKGRYRYRIFLNANYKIGINRFEDEFVSIENNQGIHGLNRSNQLKGTQKLTANLEANAFTPYYLFGFRFVMFGFMDIGLIGESDDLIFSNKLYSGLGVGMRLRNERLVFNTFQIKLAFYPTAPINADKENFSISGEKRLKPDYFFISSPEIIDF